MSIQTNDTLEKLDKEWIELIKTAIEAKIPIEEVRTFLLENTVH